MRYAAGLLFALLSPFPAFACVLEEFPMDFDKDGLAEMVEIDSCYDLWPDVDTGRVTILLYNELGTWTEFQFYGEYGEELGYWDRIIGRHDNALMLGRRDTCPLTIYWDGEWDTTPFGLVSLCD